ncbi:alpha/beta hydrolase [Actibacterium sp. MT2.3-13A]|uniref:alpha/beta fold hydrolase n=1 Tax=Actibacterium sp. MT2.3-13A TaxID=2828332 RepID=UPI001BA6A9DD|nr:alpha/beta hydrolase [Actibacterium sp. MT2.3-13A]
MSEPSRILLIHGAWGRADSWRGVARLLERRGHEVAAIDLPGHGDDPTPPGTVRLADYAARIVAELEKGPPALLVGHSMGGMAISAAAELAPERIRKLVYLCAFLPRDGDSLLSLKKREAPTIGAAVRPGPEKGTTVLDPELAVEYLCQNASGAARRQVQQGLGPQSNKAQTDPVQLTAARFGTVPRVYILCEDDRTITPELQRTMASETPCDQMLSLPGGHLPQITAPAALAEILDKL